jgi:sugar phosphate permease
MEKKRPVKLIIFLLLVISYNSAYFVRDFIKITNEAESIHNSLGNVFYYGSFISLFTFVYGVGKFFLGTVVDRKNERKIFVFALLSCAFTNFVFFV